MDKKYCHQIYSYEAKTSETAVKLYIEIILTLHQKNKRLKIAFLTSTLARCNFLITSILMTLTLHEKFFYRLLAKKIIFDKSPIYHD